VEDLFDRLDDRCFNLIVIGQPEAVTQAQGFSGLVRTHVIPSDRGNAEKLAQAQLSEPCFFLCRPDGHIGLAGTRLDLAAIARYLSDCHVSTHSGSAARSS
jgi:hypothetical protein